MAQTNFRPLSYAEGVAAAKAEGKLVFIDIYTTWCGPCALMATNVFPQQDVGDYFNEKFVCLKIDAEKGDGVELAKRFGVTGYPTFVVLDADGNVLGSRIGAILDGQEFVAAIDRIADPAKSPERLKERYAQGERSAELIAAYAGYLIDDAYQGQTADQAQIDEAYRIVKAYFDQLTDSQKAAAENAFIYLQYAESPMDEYGRYMITHHAAFDPSVKQDIADHIATLYETYLLDIFCGRRPFHREEFDTAKQDVARLGLNEDGRYTPVFRLIETYAKGDINAFLNACEQEYKHLSDDDKNHLILGMNELIKTDDKEVLQKAVCFIRRQLPTMPVANIYFAAGVIDQLENRDTHLRAIVPALPAEKR